MKKTISHFICTRCYETIKLGACGLHRKKTGHREFRPVYTHPGRKDA